jgi:hypothetical protein
MHRIAQIGAGRMGSVHLRNAAAHPELDLAFVVDLRPDVAAWLMPDPVVEIFAWASCLVDPAIAEAGKAPPETGYTASLRSLELAEAAAASVKSGAPVPL